MPCHLRFVSNSCHFCSRCIWGPFGMLRLSVCTPSRNDGIASRDSDRSGRCTSAEADRRTAPLRTNVPESGCPRPVSASNSWIIVIIHRIWPHIGYCLAPQFKCSPHSSSRVSTDQSPACWSPPSREFSLSRMTWFVSAGSMPQRRDMDTHARAMSHGCSGALRS